EPRSTRAQPPPRRYAPRRAHHRSGRARQDVDPAQAPAPDGRARGDRVPARQDEGHHVERGLLRGDEALTLAPAAVRMRFPLALAAVIIATTAVPAWAQADRDPYSGAPLPPRARETPSPIRDRFYIRGTFYDPQLRTYLRNE